ncbi:MAG TPA: polyprenol monophosphomannose synthase [Polyangiaceae bacterium]|nr:polyprenol monophosphomannose synthase [Polyangiaceae bacterium]
MAQSSHLLDEVLKREPSEPGSARFVRGARLKAELGQRALIVVPTYNERANLEEFLAAVRGAAPLAHVLIVDDNSPDGTGTLAEALAASDALVSVLHRPRKLGLGTAYVAGFRWGLARDFRHFLEMDTDFSHDPVHLGRIFAALEAGADAVLGSRNVPGGSVRGWGLGRRFLSKGGSLYSRLVLGVKIRDLTTGYKAFSRRALHALDLGAIHSNGYAFQIELTYRALRAGLRVSEVPITFVDRRVGQSKMDQRIFLEAVGVVWRLRLDALRGEL